FLRISLFGLRLFAALGIMNYSIARNQVLWLVLWMISIQACVNRPRLIQDHPHFWKGISKEVAITEIVAIDSADIELLEWAVFEETNRQRERLRLSVFKYESKLQMAARRHSEEMVALDYFSHSSPVESRDSLRKRALESGIKEGAVGENIAIHSIFKRQDIVIKNSLRSQRPSNFAWRNQGVQLTYQDFAQTLVDRWMKSPPHRSNILNKHFRFLGVGCARGKYLQNEVFYVTQNFSTTNY
ncbi:MAG: CAP domain-containing protein, partial [bacterium]